MAGRTFGVIEGFYSRPWSHEQRLDLYDKMRQLDGLNAYLFAPKDDPKHRPLWREAYDQRESAVMKALIQACSENGVSFIYGISPGLDMTYSSEEDLEALKRKLDGLVRLGCSHFAILWDDIDVNLPDEDEHRFASLAEAHVHVVNEVFAHLGRSSVRMIVCPVEYCSNRADPSVAKSEYLRTLGGGLHPSIDIFWTGATVVPAAITKEELIELGAVIMRKPLLWENLYANDYDQQRLFLGPYSGRDPDIIPHVSGVMINPNCQHSFNVPALCTLSAWSQCYNEDSGLVGKWDPLEASRDAVPHFLAEIRRPTSTGFKKKAEEERHDFASVHAGVYRLERDATLSQASEIEVSDVELLFHLFWLPHSHGPRGKEIAAEFRFLRDRAHVIHGFSNTDSNNDEVLPGEVRNWMERVVAFNATVTKLGKLCDKLAFIDNRQLFFDLNPYLNSLSTMLRACSRYLKWAGFDGCRKPIASGPSLAGLCGGLTGDLQRLFPAQDNRDYPLVAPIAASDKNALLISVVKRRDADAFLKKCERLRRDDDGSSGVSAKAVAEAFLEGGGRVRVLSAERGPDAALSSFLVATGDVPRVVRALAAVDDRDLFDDQDAFKDIAALGAFFAFPEALFTKALENMIELMSTMLLGDIAEEADCKKSTFGVLICAKNDVQRSFLASLRFLELRRGKSFLLMIRNENDNRCQ